MKSIFNSKILVLFIALVFAVSCTEDSPSLGKETSSGVDGIGGGSGQGGSLARFTIANNHLYVVTFNAIFTYSLANAAEPEYKGKTSITTVAETVYSMGDYLFLGTQNGVEILSISNPANPTRVSTYSHITSCDPVVARGNYAYSTLRTGTNCNRGVNMLDVINISNIKNPYAENSISMENPKGLGISGEFLYVCDNSKLKTFEILSGGSLKYLREMPINGCFDVIGQDGKLIVVSADGVSQFTVDGIGDLALQSKISVE